MASWTCWWDAFRAAGEAGLVLELEADEYAQALAELNPNLLGSSRYVEACRDGQLLWWDGLGRRVHLYRLGGPAHKRLEESRMAEGAR